MTLEVLMKIAKRSPNLYQHSAGIYTRSGKLIVATSNRYDSHAEHRVINRYFAVDKFRRQKAYSIVVIRISRNGSNLSYSKPCAKCQGILDQLNIKVIHS